MSLSSSYLSPESGNAWWFHSELVFPNDLVDLPPLPTRNVIQWIPFGTQDVSQLEVAYERYCSKKATSESPQDFSSEESLKMDELVMPERFVKVKCDTRQYLKVDLERMRMGPIYWQGEEYFVRRATWFLVPENAKITEGFPVERGLEALLSQRYRETLDWINTPLEPNRVTGDDTIVEKIVSLVSETEVKELSGDHLQTPIQLHDPQAPDISKYFLVFRQGCNDYARLCVDKKTQPGKRSVSKGASPFMTSESISGATLPLDAPAVLPLESMNPISATSTVLSASVSATDLNELPTNTGHLRHDSHNSWLSSGSVSGSGPISSNSSVTPVSSSPVPQTTTANGSYPSFRLYRTYVSFYHSIASGTDKGVATRVQTQRQTSELEAGEALKEPKSKKTTTTTGNNNNNTGAFPSGVNYATSNPAIDGVLAWKGIKAQSHTFRGHPLPSPEIPMKMDAPVSVKYAIFAVHGVGQRAFRKMGFHFNKDCDELRNVLVDAAQARGLPTGSVVVFPVSWRAELNLAGNFSFGDDEDDGEDGDDRDDRDDRDDGEEKERTRATTKATTTNTNTTTEESVKPPSPKIDKDLQELSDSFNAGLDATSVSFQRAVSVFQGQFTEIFERLALESIPAVRSVLSDAIMDILLYVSQKHFKKIMGAVVKEVLRLHRLFTHWNPQYEGEFSFLGHSLGSALVADLLSYTVQPDELLAKVEEGKPALEAFSEIAEGNFLPFKVDKYFAFGSPLGIFHLLKHTKPIGCLRSPNILTALSERSRKWRAARRRPGGEDVKEAPDWIIYNCRLFYNVFHPHDPVAHRFESLSMGKPRGCLNGSNSNSTTTTTLPPPLKIPYHKSGLTRFKMDVEAKIARAKDDWAKLTFKLPTWLGGNNPDKSKTIHTENANDPVNGNANANVNDPVNGNENEKDVVDESGLFDDNPLSAFNHHFRRVDFSLQDSVMENPYISALGAHFVYWSDLDIAAFIVSELIKKERDRV